jgi:Ser/Thr protein kinase RdoA (MazF antagonist)
MRAAGIADDAGLPALVAFGQDGLGAILRRHGIRVGDEPPRVLGHHPGERCTLRVQGLVVKAYHEDPAPLVTAMEALAAAGLADGHAPTAPPIVAYDPELRFIVTPLFRGRPMPDLVRGGEGRRAGELAARWLRAAAGCRLEVGALYGAESLDRRLEEFRPQVERADPALAQAVRELRVGLFEDVPAGDTTAVLHGAFSPRHVIELPDGPGVIDLDGVGHGPVALDAGMMLAALSRMGTGRHDHDERAACDAFRDGVADVVDAGALRWYQAAQLLKLVSYLASGRNRRWRERADALLREARAIADSR